MRKTISSLIIASVLFLFGIASAVQIKYDPGIKEGYYALVENVSGKWTIRDISDSPVKRNKENQEVLLISKDLIYVQPVFEADEKWSWIDGLTFKCKLGANKEKEKYTPCNSDLTGLVNTDFFFIAGNSRYAIYSKKMSQLLKETDLVERVAMKAANAQKEMSKEAVVTDQISTSSDKKESPEKQMGIALQCPYNRSFVSTGGLPLIPYNPMKSGPGKDINAVIDASFQNSAKSFCRERKENCDEYLPEALSNILKNVGYDVFVQKYKSISQPEEYVPLTLVEKKKYPIMISCERYDAALRHINTPDFDDVNMFGRGVYKATGVLSLSVSFVANIISTANGELVDRIEFKKQYKLPQIYRVSVQRESGSPQLLEDTRPETLKQLLQSYYADVTKIFSSYDYMAAYELVKKK
jgi:hypothetical protein